MISRPSAGISVRAYDEDGRQHVAAARGSGCTVITCRRMLNWRPYFADHLRVSACSNTVQLVKCVPKTSVQQPIFG
jgi:hypothetical protein